MSIFHAKRYSQPRGLVELDRSNRLSVGIQGTLVPGFNDYLITGSVSHAYTGDNLGILGNGSSFIHKNVSVSGTSATILFLGNLLSSSSVTSVVSLGTNGAGDQAFVIQGAQLGVASPRAFIRTTAGGGFSSVEPIGSNSNTSYTNISTWIAVYDGTPNLSLYNNGIDVTGTRPTNGASGNISSFDNICLGGLNRGVDQFAANGQQEYLGIYWNRALTPQEIREISDNPWQVFRPIERQIWVPLATITYSNAEASTLGAASQAQVQDISASASGGTTAELAGVQANSSLNLTAVASAVSTLLGTQVEALEATIDASTPAAVAVNLLQTHQVRTSQPQSYVDIDWSNPICKGLISVMNPVTGKIHTPKGIIQPSFDTRPNVVGNRTGTSYHFDGVSTSVYHDLWAPVSQLFPTNEISFLAQYQIDTVASDKRFVAIGNNTVTSGSAIAFGTGLGDANQLRVWLATPSLAEYRTANYFANAGALRTAVTSIPTGATLAPASFYVDGYLAPSQTDTSPSSVFNFSSAGLNRISYGSVRRANIAAMLYGKMSIGAVWNRALSVEEGKSITANPWQIFQARTNTLFTTVAVSGNVSVLLESVLSNLFIGLITTSAGASTTSPAAQVNNSTQTFTASGAAVSAIGSNQANYTLAAIVAAAGGNVLGIVPSVLTTVSLQGFTGSAAALTTVPTILRNNTAQAFTSSGSAVPIHQAVQASTNLQTFNASAAATTATTASIATTFAQTFQAYASASTSVSGTQRTTTVNTAAPTAGASSSVSGQQRSSILASMLGSASATQAITGIQRTGTVQQFSASGSAVSTPSGVVSAFELTPFAVSTVYPYTPSLRVYSPVQKFFTFSPTSRSNVLVSLPKHVSLVAETRTFSLVAASRTKMFNAPDRQYHYVATEKVASLNTPNRV